MGQQHFKLMMPTCAKGQQKFYIYVRILLAYLLTPHL